VKRPARSRKPFARSLRRAYRLLLAHFGHQNWWPAQSPFEVCVGAILTQNTNWSNVERAIANLRAAHCLEPERLFALPDSDVASLIRPAGYFNVKTRRLRAFVHVLVNAHQTSLPHLLQGTRAEARARLLAIPGIGPETADSMLLYSGAHLSFVIDAYTRRIFARHGWCAPDTPYEQLQTLCESSLIDRPPDRLLDYWQDYHAQLVQTGKHFCRPAQPRCEPCPLRALLPATGPQLDTQTLVKHPARQQKRAALSVTAC
jgi:endonuclease III related protein